MSDLHSAIQAEVHQYQPSLTPPLATLWARKRRRDHRRAGAAAAMSAAALVTIVTIGVPSMPGNGRGDFVAPGTGAPIGAPAEPLPAPTSRVGREAFSDPQFRFMPASD